MQKIAVGMVMIHCTACYVSTKQLLQKIEEDLIPLQCRRIDCMTSFEIPPSTFLEYNESDTTTVCSKVLSC